MSQKCEWCGDHHGVDQLCQRAQQGMTRRSFCFLFGAGVAAALLPAVPTFQTTLLTPFGETFPERGWIMSGQVVARKIYLSNGNGKDYRLIGTINDNTTRTFIDNGMIISNIPIVGEKP